MGKVSGNATVIRYIDLGWIEELQAPFILGASAGIFSAILEESISMAGVSGRARYEQAAMKVVGVFEPFEAEIRVDGSPLATGRFALVAVGGARHRGGMLPVLPLSDLADGLLDVCAVPAAGRDDVMGALLKIASGEHLGEPGVRYTKGSAVEIVSQQPLGLEHDGEIDRQELCACHIVALPSAVPVVSPLVPLLG
jgi:diacylglycerol kinase family enzyme